MTVLTYHIVFLVQLVNWLMYYRQMLHGKSIEELRAQRVELKKQETSEIEALPSQKQFQKNRIDEV